MNTTITNCLLLIIAFTTFWTFIFSILFFVLLSKLLTSLGIV